MMSFFLSIAGMREMSFFEWDSSLDVGVDELNDQHKELIARMETVYQTNESGTKDEIVAKVQHLMDYVVLHFTYEEKYLESIDYPTLEAHKKIHSHLVSEMTEFAKDFVNGPSEKIEKSFMTFLEVWVSSHISIIDGKYNPEDQ